MRFRIDKGMSRMELGKDGMAMKNWEWLLKRMIYDWDN